MPPKLGFPQKRFFCYRNSFHWNSDWGLEEVVGARGGGRGVRGGSRPAGPPNSDPAISPATHPGGPPCLDMWSPPATNSLWGRRTQGARF